MTFDCPAAIMSAIERHCFSVTTKEVGGILVGTIRSKDVRVTGAIPALSAVGTSANVTFTHGVWEDVHKRLATDFPDARIVGWYHSHPGFGVFLSEYDRFIQTNFFSDEAMRALVVDPLAGESGWFGWVKGKTELIETFSTTTAGLGSPAEAAPSGRSRPNGVAALAAVAALLIGGIAGYFYADSGEVTPRPAPATANTAELEAARAESASLRRQLAAASKPGPPRSGGTVTYRVRRGDSLWTLAESFFGSGFQYRRLIDANPGTTRELAVGQVLKIPADPR